MREESRSSPSRDWLSAESYPGPSLRHSRDIDLLVSPPDISRAGTVLGVWGSCPMPGAGRRTIACDTRCTHPACQRCFTAVSSSSVPITQLRKRLGAEQRNGMLGTVARVLSPEDSLVHTCVHATTGRHRDSLLWVCDAWFLLRTYPELDWELVTELTRRFRLSLALADTLAYLSRELGAAVPAAVLAGFPPNRGWRPGPSGRLRWARRGGKSGRAWG